MAEDNEISKIANDSINTPILSKKERKITVITVIIFSLIIVILLALITEAYINQHPVLELFLQTNVFKPMMKIQGSISLSMMFTGVLLYAPCQCLFLLNNFQFKKILLIPISCSIFFILFSIFILSISYNWQLQYAACGYISFFLLIIGAIGRMTNITLQRYKYLESYKFALILQKIPFQLLLFIGIITNTLILE